MTLLQRTLSPLARACAVLALLLVSALALAQTVTYFDNDVSGTPVLATDASGANKPTFPKTSKEKDQFLGMEGKRVPDTAGTPGRDKVVWQPNSNTKITLEQHPYHPNAPDWHRGPHYHVDTPGKTHERFLPGNKIPGF